MWNVLKTEVFKIEVFALLIFYLALLQLWDAHLLFIQKHETHYHYVDVPPYCTIFEETGDLEETQTDVYFFLDITIPISAQHFLFMTHFCLELNIPKVSLTV